MVDKTYEFQAEVSRLLEIVTHSLYSNKEIFLRELLSNAADACDRLRYEALTHSDLTKDEGGFKITITPDKKTKTLIITDNGIGMSRQDLIDNLGTIARSGTTEFLNTLKKDKNKKEETNLIGQFGVGFYSAFMVADEVDVLTRKAGTDKAYLWKSKGLGTFEIEDAEKEGCGTRITLHLKKGEEEYLEPARLQHIVKTYSDYITVPIFLVEDKNKEAQINSATPLWSRPKKDITAEQYKEFYHQIAHAFDEPWDILHYHVEGVLEYTALLFIPESKPFDLFDPKREVHIKLYIKKVFITADCQELLPGFLRFVRGVVDAQDLPLSISREMLQHEPRLIKMRSGMTKKILEALNTKSTKDPQAYLKFWKNFGAVLKEGLYEDIGQKDAILPLCRFQSSLKADWISLEEYVKDLQKGQKDIYYLSGPDIETLKHSPQLEGFTAKKINVLFLTDHVDEFWTTMVDKYKDHPLKSITSHDINLKDVGEEENKKEKKKDKEKEPLTNLEAFLKVVYGTKVKDVKTSQRLTNSPVCLVADEQGMHLRLQKLMGQDQFIDLTEKRTLEINPTHPIIQFMEKNVDDKKKHQLLEDTAWLLLDEALILEGNPVKSAASFADRLNRVLEKVDSA